MFFSKKENKRYDWLIAGLGNPGAKYAGNRHNIGFMVVDAIAEKYKLEWQAATNIYYTAEWKYAGKQVCLAKPTTYMNNSGEAVKKLCDRHFIPKSSVLVIVDEYNFSVGKVHVKNTGGDGGHNGVSSVIQELGVSNFFKMRCGIGKGFPPGGMADYVLRDFESEVEEDKNTMINNSIIAIEHILKTNSTKALSDINSERLFQPKEEAKQSKESDKNE